LLCFSFDGDAVYDEPIKLSSLLVWNLFDILRSVMGNPFPEREAEGEVGPIGRGGILTFEFVW